MTRRMTAFLTVGAVMLVAALAGAWVAAGPGATVVSSVNEAVTIECTGATGATAGACRAWGEAVLADDAPPRTFEREDLRRLRLDRAFLGLGGECRAEWYLSRYPDSPVWSDEVACQ